VKKKKEPEAQNLAGYEGGFVDEPMSQLWILNKIPSGVHRGVLAQVVCNGDIRGTLVLKDEGEFEWLKPRIDSERRLVNG